ncbi:DUF3426 domain-containing protein [Phenylobacterium sp.]|uniref:DUF3426 domain-containing protein n=1 Tax=Phenylobacterium sp. TaxID=1871053 RepID=UPI0025D4898D|nr:DUF3426 domain-containing protein [Phenylobacterium sp.]
MILTCPECATSYFVDDLRIPRGGRMVKCTTCGNRWRAFQDRSLAEREPPEEEMLVEGPREPQPPTEEDIDFVAAPATPSRKPAPEKKASPALVAGLTALAVVTAALGAAVIFRQQVVGIAPATAPIFAAIGLPVNTLGLVIEAKSQPAFQAGRPVLSVTGSIRNVNKSPTEAPPMRISLLDRNGKAVGGMVAQPLNAKIPPGATRYFAVTLPDPPAGVRELDIAFEPASKGKAAPETHGEPAAHAEGAAPPAPAPVEAQPLPADSPDALKKHEQH